MYDLQAFRKKVQELYRRSSPYDDGRHATQGDLAEAIGLHPTELSKRLNGARDAHLSDRDVRAIVLALTEWGAIQSQAEALDLLTLVCCASFSAAEWQSPPLDSLAPLKPEQATPSPKEVRSEPPRSNLPRALNSFVGRRQEMAEVEQLLTQTRLLTVTGAGGCGKTRLALEVAARRVASFADGVWLVELAALSDPQLLPQAVAATLRVREQSGTPLLDTLAASLYDRDLLLVLDNCEHLVQAVAALVHQLLLRCPRLLILTTSREPLRTEGEVVWRLPSMSLPEPQTRTTLRSLAQYEAIRLFIERAKATLPEMTLTQSNAAAVREVCARLDGIPLAIELAAAMVRVMSVEQIRTRLDDRFALLTVGSRTVLPRQQTLKALIDWSYDLLTAEEQRLLARLAVFAGGFSLEAAEAVCADPSIRASAVAIGLGRLVDKSLVLREEQEDSNRYHLLETIRQYAAAKLAADDEEQVRRRHAEHYLTLAERAEPELRGAQQVIWLNRLQQEHDNLRAALGWSLTRKQAEAVLALRTSKALMRFWLVRGYLREGCRWLEEALAKSSGASALTRASAFSATGILSASSGDYTAAHSFFEESLKIYRELGDNTGIAHVLNNLGNVALDSGDLALARAFHEESLKIRRELGDSSEIATSLNNLGNVTASQNDFVTARALHEESLMLKRRLGDQAGVAASLNNLAAITLQQGDYPAADQLYRESLLIKRRLGDRVSMAYSLEGLGYVAVAQGAFTRAVRLLAAGASLRDSISAPLSADEKEQFDDNIAVSQANLGEVMFTAAWLKGWAMSLEQAVIYALAEEG